MSYLIGSGLTRYGRHEGRDTLALMSDAADLGFRLMAHADPAAAIGDRVQGGVRTIADRPLPYFERISSP